MDPKDLKQRLLDENQGDLEASLENLIGAYLYMCARASHGYSRMGNAYARTRPIRKAQVEPLLTSGKK